MRLALATAAALLLAACGFQLRGASALPFDTLYLPGATGGIALELKRNIQSGSATRVVDDPKAAEAQLLFSEETRAKEILALSSAGRVREFRLVYRVRFSVGDGKGSDFLAPSTVTLTRDVTYDDAVALAKETEELLLYRDMQADMVQQIMRRLSAARRPESAN
ncbi:MAG: LPS assembly lipoprotein LptE [Betaproteobacteria bacterium]|nr:LPS assembly lipoprotein LptE [Betaproteobacteria bacterium]MDH4324235.1 LPS assembly lipoprotein LptE [Betaproteobacteria bacterium]MDH5211942.1 LPS assembly lipoprotein LptE [Betaproteobacteria bacterium]MDH5577664.1 LPS assembly lipoprotein LptE [Betaproteobacteria bacterium]